MKSIKNIAIAVCLLSSTACTIFKSSSAESQETSMITDKRWKLVELGGKPVADSVNGKEPFLLLHTNDSRYSASGGCNGIGGTFTLAGHGKIKFAQGMSTKMACENMEIENELTRVLIAADNYTLKGDSLSLNKARMAPLARFKAVQ